MFIWYSKVASGIGFLLPAPHALWMQADERLRVDVFNHHRAFVRLVVVFLIAYGSKGSPAKGEHHASAFGGLLHGRHHVGGHAVG